MSSQKITIVNMKMLNPAIKKIIPSTVKLRYKVMKRYCGYIVTGKFMKLVRFTTCKESENRLYKERIIISQELKKTAYSDNKRYNLARGIARIQNIAIAPDRIFSFWHLVGEPNQKNGYLEGRAIVSNQVQTDFGGGLCQLSGLIYYLILKAGLVPLERHAHSQDIYTEEARFAPLGSDATVVYGYKDLQFQNTLSVPICFRFTLLEHEIVAALCSQQPIAEFQIEFKREKRAEGTTKVDTIRCDRSTSTHPL